MNCPKCKRENAEVFTGLINGQLMPNSLANFCRRCGNDLRPFHIEIMKISHLRPIEVSRNDVVSHFYHKGDSV